MKHGTARFEDDEGGGDGDGDGHCMPLFVLAVTQPQNTKARLHLSRHTRSDKVRQPQKRRK